MRKARTNRREAAVLKLFAATRSRRAEPETSSAGVDVHQAQPNELPADLMAAIDACTLAERAPDEDGAPRVVVQLAGRQGGWVHGVEASRKAIAARWPDLSERQMRRALRFLDNAIAIRLQPVTRRKRTTWVTSWREDDAHA
jgi:hypothetical protein